jgi:hypothetical protein
MQHAAVQECLQNSVDLSKNLAWISLSDAFISTGGLCPAFQGARRQSDLKIYSQPPGLSERPGGKLGTFNVTSSPRLPDARSIARGPAKLQNYDDAIKAGRAQAILPIGIPCVDRIERSRSRIRDLSLRHRRNNARVDCHNGWNATARHGPQSMSIGAGCKR